MAQLLPYSDFKNPALPAQTEEVMPIYLGPMNWLFLFSEMK